MARHDNLPATPADRPGPADRRTWLPVTGVVLRFGLHDTQPHGVARLAFTLDPDLSDDVCFLYRLRGRILRLDRKDPVDEDQERVRQLSQARPGAAEDRRWELPRRFTAGARVFVTDVCFPLTYLPDGGPDLHPWRDNVLLPCRASPEPGIGFEVLPYTAEHRRHRQEQFLQRLEGRGVSTTAALVQANPLLFRPGEETLPALVLVTFEEGLPDRERLLLRLAREAYDLKEYQPRNADERLVADIVLASDEGAAYHHREPLPRGFTGGRVVYAADLWLFRPYLRHGRLEGEKLLPVLAEPGPRGGIEQLPPAAMAAVPAAVVLEAAPAEPDADIQEAVVLDKVQRAAAPRRSGRRLWPWLVGGSALLLLGVLGLVLAGVMLLSPWADNLVVLSNVQMRRTLPGRATYQVDYRFTANPDPSARYFLVAESSIPGLRAESGIAPATAQGTVAVNVFQPVGMATRLEFHVEEERPGKGRRRVSKTLSP
jgi:hypothetical protein